LLYGEDPERYERVRPGYPADFDSPTRRAIGEAYARHAPEIVHRGVAGHPRPAFGPVPAGVAFAAPALLDYPWTCTYTAGSWVDLMRSASDHRMLPEERREEALAAVARAIVAHGGTYEHRGPAMSGARPDGLPRESSTSRSATSPASTGWNRKPAGTGIRGSGVYCHDTPRRKNVT